MTLIRKLIGLNIKASRAFDRLLPKIYRIDGNRYFVEQFVPPYLVAGLCVYDLGGGKQPHLQADVKRELKLNITGVDIDQGELDKAPPGVYDRTICTDISQFTGWGDADLVICRALLEHVRNVDAAFAAIESILKPGGRALIFVPSRNALYARLNLLLPQTFKKRLLHAVYPQTRRGQGFISFYDQCTPRDFRQLARKHHLSVEQESFHYISSYFAFFVPAYVLWRLWLLGYRSLAGEQAAETFCMALVKPLYPVGEYRDLPDGARAGDPVSGLAEKVVH